MLALRRRYLVALALSALFAVGFVVVPNIVSSARAAHDRAELDAALAGLHHLRVPAKLVPLTTNCGGYRCFRVAQPTPQAAYRLANAMLRTMGATPEPGQRCFSRPSEHGPVTLCADIIGSVDSEPLFVSISPYGLIVHGHYVPHGSEVEVDFLCGIGPTS